MLNHRGFTAWIQVDGRPVPEYLVAVDGEAHRVSCWIPGKEGQVFTVYWQDEGGRVDTCAFITLDGMLVPGRFLYGEGIACRGGIRTSMNTERPFQFQKLNDETLENPSPSRPSRDAGTVMLKIKRIRRVEYHSPNSIQPIPSVLGKRKAGDLCVGFGLEVKAPEQLPSTFKVASYEDQEAAKPTTYVTFIFRYRSPEFLEAQGIATIEETTPPPAAGKKKRVTSSSRRVSSLPPPRPSGAEESEESSASGSAESSREPTPIKTKRRKLDHSHLAFPTFPTVPTGSRRPSAELRRAASWSAMGPPPTPVAAAPVPGPSGQHQYFLPSPVQPAAEPGPSGQHQFFLPTPFQPAAEAGPSGQRQVFLPPPFQPAAEPGPSGQHQVFPPAPFQQAVQPDASGQLQFFLPPPVQPYNMPSTLPTLSSLNTRSAQASVANSPADTESPTTESPAGPSTSRGHSF